MTTPTSESATREAAAALDGVETTRPAAAVRADERSTGRPTEPATASPARRASSAASRRSVST